MRTHTPLVSFIILSYNYKHYIGQTIESILAQTESNIEIIVVDDGSIDGSAEFVRSIADPRIVLIQNEKNIGACLSFAKAFAMSRGEYIANVDSDDWIEPDRTKKQLALFDQDPNVDVVGTWVRFVDAHGRPHPKADELENTSNFDWGINKVDSWVVQNRLCRSSTILKRRIHEEDGLYDVDMTYAPDFEFWTRLLRNGRRFALVEQSLTNYRLHDKNLTHANARGTLIEIAYLMSRNVIPLAYERGIPKVVADVLHYIIRSGSFPLLDAHQRLRLLGLVFSHPRIENFGEFRDILFGKPDSNLQSSGANLLALSEQAPLMEARLRWEISQYIEARDWWRAQAEARQARSETQQRLGERAISYLHQHPLSRHPRLEPLRRWVGRMIQRWCRVR